MDLLAPCLTKQQLLETVDIIYKPETDRLQQMEEHEQVTEEDEDWLLKVWHEDVRIFKKCKQHKKIIIKKPSKFSKMLGG